MHEDMREAWSFGNGKEDLTVRKIKYFNLVFNNTESAFYSSKYQNFIINKVVIVLDKFLYNEYLYLFSGKDKHISHVMQSSAPANNGRIAFFRDPTKSLVSSNLPSVKEIDHVANVKVVSVGRRSRMLFRVYPKCKDSISMSNMSGKSLQDLIELMNGDFPNIYFGPYSNATAYNSKDAEELQEIGIHFRIRVYVYVTYSKMYLLAKDVMDVNVM